MTTVGADREITTSSISVEGATIVFDIAAGSGSAQRPLMLIGQPMGASGFTELRAAFGDRSVITYDPRGAERSVKDDPMLPIGPNTHADDLHRVIQEAGGGPVDMFASSGGAINSLALVAKYPDDVHTLVAHEPPLASALPDAEHAMTAVATVHDTYQKRGLNHGLAHFIAVTNQRGPMTAEFAAQQPPDPQMFGMPTDDDGDRTNALLGSSMIALTSYGPDWDALRAAPTHIVIGAGETSAGQMANRGAYAVAERLGLTPVVFPSGHGGFATGEWEPGSDPVGFAAKLREVLEQP